MNTLNTVRFMKLNLCSLPHSSSSSSPTPCESDRSSLPGAGSTPLDWWLSQTWPSQPSYGILGISMATHGHATWRGPVLGRWPQH